MTTRDVLVICTRNRPADLTKCLESISKQETMPWQVLIVDQSTDDATRTLCSEGAILDSLGIIRYVKCPGQGLTLSRNFAMLHIERGTEIVHWIDDDVELNPPYIRELNESFRKNPDAVGLTGVIREEIEPKTKSSGWMVGRIRKLSGLDAPRGKISWAGVNVGAGEPLEEMAVEWLPGCSMSYRVSDMLNFRFDERRTNYSLGEDVDFSLKVGSLGKLLCVPSARLKHNLSPMNREKHLDILRQDVVHRWMLAEDKLGKVSKLGVAVSVLTHIAFCYLAAIGSNSQVKKEEAKALRMGIRAAVWKE